MFKSIHINDTPWTVRESFGEDILAELMRKMGDHADSPDFSVIKDNNVRTALMYRTGHASWPVVFVKRYKCRHLKDACKHLVVPSKARSEWHSLCYFNEVGIPCPQPLAFDEQRYRGGPQDGFLMMAALDTAEPLNEYATGSLYSLEESARVRESFHLTRQLAALIRKLHEHRIYFRDLHAGNILVQPGDGMPELYLIDLHRAARLPVLLPRMKNRDLAQLSNSLRLSRSDRWRFLEEYCRGLDISREELYGLQSRIHALSLKLKQRRILSRSKRCIKNSTVFEKKHTGDEHYYGRRDFGRQTMQRAIESHIEQRKKSESEALKSSSKSVLTVHATGFEKPLCVKGYRNLGLGYSLKNLLRTSRAYKSWVAANGLTVRGIETPQPLALLEKRRGLLVMESYFITRWLPDAMELNPFVQRLCRENPGEKDAFIQSLADVIQKLHDQDIYQADLKSNNILVEQRDDGGWAFSFVDLDRVYFDRRLSFNLRAKNLAQINASVADCMTVKDRLKFFRYYAKDTSLYPERKKYYRRILEIGRTKITEPYGLRFE